MPKGERHDYCFEQNCRGSGRRGLLACLGSASFAADVGAGVSIGGAGGISGGAGVSTGRSVTGGAGLSIGGSSGVNGGVGTSTAGGDGTNAGAGVSIGGSNGVNGGAGASSRCERRKWRRRLSIGGADGVNVDVGLGTASVNPGGGANHRQRGTGVGGTGLGGTVGGTNGGLAATAGRNNSATGRTVARAVGQGTRPLQAPLRRSAGQLERLRQRSGLALQRRPRHAIAPSTCRSGGPHLAGCLTVLQTAGA